MSTPERAAYRTGGTQPSEPGTTEAQRAAAAAPQSAGAPRSTRHSRPAAARSTRAAAARTARRAAAGRRSTAARSTAAPAVRCGPAVRRGAAVRRQPTRSRTAHPALRRPSNYLVWAILTTILCCLPLGIASIVFSSQVNTKWRAAATSRGALNSSKPRPRQFAMWSAIVGGRRRPDPRHRRSSCSASARGLELLTP